MNGNQLASSVHGGNPLSKWFKSKADEAGFNSESSNVISATSNERGVIRVKASDWKPSYASAVSTGAAAFVVE